MNAAVLKRTTTPNQPFSTKECFSLPVQKHSSFRTSSNCFTDAFPVRKPRSSGLLFGHSKDFKHVETFNLNPGYRLSRSAGKIYVSIQTKDPPQLPKPEPREALLNDLREQVDLLSTFLEEERLRHGGTKKRAILDLLEQEKKLKQKYEDEMQALNEAHDETLKLQETRHEARVKQIERDYDNIIEKMKTEYRMLQASFKVYQSTLQDEMQDELKTKKTEFEWEKKQSIDNAIDDYKRHMDDELAKQREELRTEFRKNMTELIKEHRLELENIANKQKVPQNINELMKRSEQLTGALEQIDKLKVDLSESKSDNRHLRTELNETQRKLKLLELQFDDKVREVENLHHDRIDNLRLEKADVTRRLVRSCEELQVEKIAREKAERHRLEAAVRTLEKFTKTLNKNDLKSEAELKGKKAPIRKSEDISKMMEDITAVMGCYNSSDMTGVIKSIVLHIGGALDTESSKTGESEYRGRKKAMSQLHQKSSKQPSGIHLKRHSTKGVKLRLPQSKSESPSPDSAPPKDDSEKPFKIRFSLDETSDAMVDAKEHVSEHDVAKDVTEKSKNSSAAKDAHSRDSGVFSATPNSLDGSSGVSQPDASRGSKLQPIDDDDNLSQKFLIPKTFECTINPKEKDQARTRQLQSMQSKSADKHAADLNTTTNGSGGHWKGTFLGRDSQARPPIIFGVEESKALSYNPPNSSDIAKKVTIHSPRENSIPRHKTEDSVSKLAESRDPSPQRPNSLASDRPVSDES